MRTIEEVEKEIENIMESCGWDENQGARHRLAKLRAELAALKGADNDRAG